VSHRICVVPVTFTLADYERDPCGSGAHYHLSHAALKPYRFPQRQKRFCRGSQFSAFPLVGWADCYNEGREEEAGFRGRFGKLTASTEGNRNPSL
jgi:hypothetical protein